MTEEIGKAVASAPTATAQDGKSGAERRRFPRYDFRMPVFVRILVEEETFNPMRFPGHTRNVSLGGLLIETDGLSENDYKMLIRRQRMVRVHAQIPGVEGEVVFFGKICWYDYRCTSRKTACTVGISFEPLHEREEKILSDLLERINSRGEVPNEPVVLT